jgi:hypothetical protein
MVRCTGSVKLRRFDSKPDKIATLILNTVQRLEVHIENKLTLHSDCLYGQVVRAPGYRSRGPG